MRVLSFDGHPLSGEAIPFYAYFSPERSPHTVSIQRRGRHRRASVRESIEINPKEYTVRVWPKETGFNITTQTFYTQISDIFSLYRDSRWLVVEWDEGGKDNHEVITAQLLVDVVSIALEDDESFIDIRVEATDPRWRSSIPSSGPPFDVNGNVEVFPVLTVTGGEVLDRYRVNIRDTTGQGLGSELVDIAWVRPASQTLVYNNGMSQPFRVSGGRLRFRVDAQPNETIFVDVYHGAAISNTETANKLDLSGKNLTTTTLTHVHYNSWEVQSHPLAATNSWRPGRIIKHPNGRPYSFGMTDPKAPEIHIVDREASGRRWDLPDNFDSIVALSNVPMQSLSGLNLNIFAGYPIIYQNSIERHEMLFWHHTAVSGSVTLQVGNKTAVLSAPINQSNIISKVRQLWGNLFGPQNIGQVFLAIQIGGENRAGLLIRFQGDLERVSVPLPRVVSGSLSLMDPDGFPILTQIRRHDEGSALSLFEPDPFFSTIDEFRPGVTTAFIAIAHRNEQDYAEIWSRTVTSDFHLGTTVNESINNLNLQNADRVAVGLRASSARVDTQNYGRLRVSGDATIVKLSLQVPVITVHGPFDARLKHGQIHSLTTGERIVLKRRITDDVPLIIDCDQRTAQAESGPEYTEGTDRTDPNSWLTFRPGLNDIDVPANWTLTAEWHDRWEI